MDRKILILGLLLLSIIANAKGQDATPAPAGDAPAGGTPAGGGGASPAPDQGATTVKGVSGAIDLQAEKHVVFLVFCLLSRVIHAVCS